MRQKLLILLVVITLALVFSFRAKAAPEDSNRITNFHSEIKVESSGQILVTETISLVVPGPSIKQKITREFPRYWDFEDHHQTVNVQVQEVKKNNNTFDYQVETVPDGISIVLNRQDEELFQGSYSFQIKYRLDRVFDFSEEQDALFYPVTGYGWRLPIEKVYAIVDLPGTVTVTDLAFDGSTGAKGSPGTNFKQQAVNTGGRTLVTYYTTSKLGTWEGFTLGLYMPKGLITEPTFQMRLNYFFDDYGGCLLGGILLLLTAAGIFQWVRIYRYKTVRKVKLNTKSII